MTSNRRETKPDEKNHRDLMVQVVRFGVVGIAATMVHVSMALIVHYRIGLSPNLSNLAGYLSAVLVSFFGQALFTFRVQRLRRYHLGRFIVVSLLAFCASSLITVVITSLGGSFALAMAVVAVAVPVASFLASKLWTFTEPHKVATPSSLNMSGVEQ